MQSRASDSRRAAARRSLLGGTPISSSTGVDAAAAAAAKALDRAFEEYCKAAVSLGDHTQATVDAWMQELKSQRTDSARYTATSRLFCRVIRGCRVTITEQRLYGCTGIVLHAKRSGCEAAGKVPVIVDMHDGTTQEVSLRPQHVQLLRGRRTVEEEAAEDAAAEAAEAAASLARRIAASQPHALQAVLMADLKTKSFAELRLMAEKVDALELLNNPLLQYDRASFREGLAEVLVHTDDGADMLSSILERADDGAAASMEEPCMGPMPHPRPSDVGVGPGDAVVSSDTDALASLPGEAFGPCLPPAFDVAPGQQGGDDATNEEHADEQVLVGPAPCPEQARCRAEESTSTTSKGEDDGRAAMELAQSIVQGALALALAQDEAERRDLECGPTLW